MRSRSLTFCVVMRRPGLERKALYLWAKNLAEGHIL
jgi:hypothetical protein